jgi:hypothetical protein
MKVNVTFEINGENCEGCCFDVGLKVESPEELAVRELTGQKSKAKANTICGLFATELKSGRCKECKETFGDVKNDL